MIDKAIDLERKCVHSSLELYKYLNTLSPDDLAEVGKNVEHDPLFAELEKEKEMLKRRLKDYIIAELDGLK